MRLRRRLSPRWLPVLLAAELAARLSLTTGAGARVTFRIGVDGVTAAGKTTFADALAALLGGVARLTIDDFHRPGQERYYPDSFDLAAFRAAVLDAPGTLVADGVFLFHPALVDLWDLKIFLRCDRDVALARGIARDGMPERYATRYVPGETRYLEEVGPEALADLVVDTT